MILSFKKNFPWGEPTDFKRKIQKGIKIHTFRKDPHDRWKKGNKVHCATGVRTKHYDCFYESICTGVQRIWIQRKQELVFLSIPSKHDNVKECWMTLPPSQVAENDGFDTADDMFRWFDKPVKLKVIHWTDFKYGY